MKIMKYVYPLFYLLITLSLYHISTITIASPILYQDNQYKLTQKNTNALIKLAEYIAGSALSLQDKKALQLWAINDFKTAPKAGIKFYQQLQHIILPKINSDKAGYYRVQLYLNYVQHFLKYPKYKQVPNNILAIINHYNPPKQEALQLNAVQHQLQQQRLNRNQARFNQTIAMQQAYHAMVNTTIRDNGTRAMISLRGDSILEETNSIFYIKDDQGISYQIVK